jgi:hypothetical protein
MLLSRQIQLQSGGISIFYQTIPLIRRQQAPPDPDVI